MKKEQMKIKFIIASSEKTGDVVFVPDLYDSNKFIELAASHQSGGEEYEYKLTVGKSGAMLTEKV